MKTTTVLATCYAVNPYKGSEDAMGWNFICQIARYRKVIAITRENNRTSIEKYMDEHPHRCHQNIRFLYYDLPYWARFWKKGGRGALLYFYLWQRTLVRFIKSKNLTFDLVHNVNFHNDWTPTFLWKLNKPLVWGPVGHHPKIPKQYLKHYPLKTFVKDRAAWMVKKSFWKYSPSLRKAVEHAQHIWCMHRGVPAALQPQQGRFSLFPSVASNDFGASQPMRKQNFRILCTGRFVPLKGFDLAIEAFAEFIKDLSPEQKTQCKLTLVGKGPEKKTYEKLIALKGIKESVEIVEWVDRAALRKIYQTSSLFLFPSHEGAGMVVAEALSASLPVICLNNNGPGELINESAGIRIFQSSYSQTVRDLKEALSFVYHDPSLIQYMGTEARRLYEQKFSWDSRGAYLNEIYTKIANENCGSTPVE